MVAPRPIIASATLLAISFGIYAFFSPDLWAKTQALEQESIRLQNEIEKAEQHNENLKKEIELLRGDAPEARRYQAKVVREELGYIQKGETLVVLPPPALPKAPSSLHP